MGTGPSAEAGGTSGRRSSLLSKSCISSRDGGASAGGFASSSPSCSNCIPLVSWLVDLGNLMTSKGGTCYMSRVGITGRQPVLGRGAIQSFKEGQGHYSHLSKTKYKKACSRCIMDTHMPLELQSLASIETVLQQPVTGGSKAGSHLQPHVGWRRPSRNRARAFHLGEPLLDLQKHQGRRSET